MIPIYESYAEALYTTTEKLGCTSAIAGELPAMEELLKQCGVFLASPLISVEKKADALRETLRGEVSPLTLAFILLMTTKRHLKHFFAAAEKFMRLSGHGGALVNMRVAYTPPQDIVEKLKERFLEEKLIPPGTDAVKLHIIEDRELIGGFVASCNGYQIDTSLRTALSRLGSQGAPGRRA